MKKMVDQLVYEVRSEKVEAKISYTNNKTGNATKSKPKAKTSSKGIVAKACPKCKAGQILKGKNAYGCSNYGKTCDFVLPFSFGEKTISENQYKRLLDKGSTVNLKGFKIEGASVEGLLRFDDNFKLKLEPKQTKAKKEAGNSDEKICPKCKTGTIIKGKTAYGCSAYKTGCDFRFSYDLIREKANGQPLTKDLVFQILNG